MKIKSAFEKFNQFIINNKEAVGFLSGVCGGMYYTIKDYKYQKLEREKYELEKEKFLFSKQKNTDFYEIKEALGIIDKKLTINNDLYLSLQSEVEMLGISPETSPNSSPNQDGEY